MEVSFSLLADAANVSTEGKLNVLGRFGNINVTGFPARHPSMALVVELESDQFEAGEQKHVQVLLSDPDGRELTRVEMDAALPESPAPGAIRGLVILDIRDLTFERAGPYSFSIAIDGVTLPQTTDFNVTLLQRPSGG